MGITELWKLLCPSEKLVSLEELASDYNSKHNGKRGLRVAIDVALWIFQSRASAVGDQSELRALFFRFCRLYELGIRPVFVFDGPNRPGYKRDRFINTVPMNSEFRQNLSKMIELFNFAEWTAYGEAEAECALLQRLGFVDFVLTGDSDIFLFGAKKVIRQWPQKRHEAVPCYDLTWITDTLGLDRSDLILIALLRGSDYNTRGTAGIGVTVAAQLAKCQYHRQLMDDIQLAGRETPLDDERVQHMFDDLTYELQHNGTRNLKKRYPNMVLDPHFPDFSIVTEFIHPLTNIGNNKSADILQKAKKLQEILNSYLEPQWIHLTSFIQKAFKWPAEYTLKRFSKLLFPGYMISQLQYQLPSNQSFLVKTTNKKTVLSVNDINHKCTQRLMNDYYGDFTKKEAAATAAAVYDNQHSHTQNNSTRNRKFEMIVQINGSKSLYNGSLKLYRVEWNKLCWNEFLEKIKIRLNTESYETIATSSQQERSREEKEQNDEEAFDAQIREGDVWTTIKRQWVNANAVHRSYPRIAIEYQAKNMHKKSNMASTSSTKQSTLDSFLVIPLKRRTTTL